MRLSTPIRHIIADPQGFAAPQNDIPVLEVQTGPTDYVVILELYVAVLSTFSSGGNPNAELGVGRPAAQGIGYVAEGVLQADNAGLTNAASGVNVYAQWSTVPTAPTNFLRRATVAFNQSNVAMNPYYSFTFPSGLKMGPSSSVVLWFIRNNGHALGQNSLVWNAGCMLDG